MNFTVQWCERKETRREAGGQSERERNSTRVINGGTEERDAYSPCKNGPPSLIFQGYWMKLMKINTLIITILKIKIEDRALVVLIFKCLRYIDQHNPVFPLTSPCRWACAVERKKYVFLEQLLKILICNTKKKSLSCLFTAWEPSEVLFKRIVSWRMLPPKQRYIRAKHINVTSYMWPLLTSQHFLCILNFKKGNEYTSNIKQNTYITRSPAPNSQPRT